MDTSSTFSDQDTCTDGGICERIAALSAASGVSRLEVTPNREDSQIHLTSFDEDVKPEPKMVSEKGVAFSVEFQEASKPLPPPRLMSRIRTKELEKTITGRENVNNEGVEAVNDRKDGAFKNKKVDLINDNHRGVVTNRGNEAFGVVQSRELGATKNKSLAFELSFNNEPRSKSSKDKERVLLRSPFKTSKMWANKNQKQLKSNANPTQSLHAEALDGVKNVICTESVSLKENNLTNGLYCDLNGGSAEKETSDENVFENIVYSPHAIHAEDGMDDEHASKILERNSFTLDSTSQEPIGASDRNTCEVVRNNESSFDLTLSGQQLSSNSVEQKQQKRNTFTLDSVLRFVDDASEKGKIPQKVSNEAPDEKYWEASKTSEQPIKHLEKGSTFILESVNQEKFQIAAVGEKSTLNKPFSVPAQTEGKCTLQSLSRSAQDTSPCQVEVTNVLDDLAHKEESNQRNANSGREGSDEASPKKRSTFTLETISHEIDSAIEKYFPSEIPRDEAGSDYHLESTEKRSTYTLDSVSHALQSGIEKGLPACQVLSQFAQQEDPSSMRVSTSEKKITKRGTFTLDDVSQSLEEGQSKGLPVDEVLAQLSNQEKEETLSACGNVEFPPKRGTFPLDSASQNLEEAEEKGIPTVEALCQLASEDKCQFDDGVSTEAVGRQRSSQKRETYTLDEVSNAIEEAIEKGIAVCLTLDHLAQEVRGNDITTSGKCARDLREADSHAQYSGQHDEYEASFEDALEKLEDCVSLGNEEAFSTSSFQPRNRGTYDLNEVSTSLLSGAKAGVPVVETLDHLSRKGNDTEKSRTCEQNRRTYTLGEVSRSLEAASEQGIPVIEALRDLTKDMSSTKTETSEHKRGTYTLDEVSNSLEHAKQTGIPVIEALESLAKEKRKSPLRLKIPDRGTYTLDEVSVTLEKAQQRGLPVVDALGHLTMHKDIPIRQSPDAVHRRQEKLVNRKTYALASPLETIGEGTKLRLYDGNQRQMMSPLSFHVKPKDSTATETKVSENKAGIVQKLDFLTTACELLLKANAKEMAREHDQSRNTETEATRLSNVDANCDQSQTDRNTYPLENVALTIKDAKEKGIPVLDSLDHVASAAEFGTNQNRTNATLLNSESDVEQITNESKQDRLTHSLENVSRTLEDAHKAGIPVIQTLDQLANELAEFSLTTMSASPWIPSLREDNTKRKRYSETAIGELQKSSSLATRLGSPYPPPIRKAYSLEDVANAVKHAFKSGTSLTDILDSIEFEKPVEPVSSSTDVRPRSVDSGFISSFSDNDISLQSVGSPYNRSKNHVFDGSNDDLVVTNIVSSELRATGLSAEANSRQDNVNQNENRRTFTFDHVTDLSRGLPVIESLGKLCNNTEENTENKNLSVQCTIPLSSKPRRKVSPPKPKRHIPKKPKSLESKTDSFFIEFYNSETLQRPIKDETSDDESKIDFNDITTSFVNESQTNDNDLVPAKDPNFVGPKSEAPTLVSSSTPYRGRATWRPSGSVLDQIASLMDAAEDCGISPADVLNQVNMPCESSGGEIEESQDETEEDPAVTSQLALLRMQLKEKRRQIEEEKRRTQVECEDQHRRLRQTAFWYVMGKTQRSEECSSLPSNQVAAMQPHSQDKPRNQLAEFPDQASPPIAWSSPANSPLPSSVTQPSSDDQQFETREFRLSDHPPVDIEKIRPSSQPTVERNSRPTPVPPRPSSHDPAASHNAASTRKCWNVESGTKVTPTPLARRDMAVVNVDTNDEAFTLEGGTKEENEAGSASKKGLAMFIGDNLETQGLTPDQEKKREKFLRMRQKKQEEDRTRKEAELEKKRKREERQREKEILKKTEQERIRQEELVRERAEQELRMKEAQAARVPDSFGTYRRAGPWQPAYDTSDDANIYLEPSHQQPSGFADFSGPQCYVKPSGKSNRKIIVNAISYVCLSGTVNQEQKEKCLQAISECDGHHFMILFKDGLKFRGIYIHNLDNDQLYKVFGIGPRVVTSKMIEFLYKYNSGGKEFTKIPSKTISLSVDGFAMQKSCWNTGKPVVASKTSSNFKRPPRPSQR